MNGPVYSDLMFYDDIQLFDQISVSGQYRLKIKLEIFLLQLARILS